MAKNRTDTESVLKLVIDGKQANNSIKELKDTYIKLNTELNNMKKSDNPKAYAEKVSNIKKVEQAWKDAREEIKNTSKEATGFRGQLKDLAKDAAGGLFGAGALYGLINGVKTMIQKNAELSDSFAGVMKTTGLGEEAVDRLNEKFKQMDTRTANTKLLELAQVAGKLGYSAEKDVEGFVRAADKIGVALGEDLGGVEESVNSLGKLVNIFKISDQFELEESLLKVGSAINTLGASGTANEKNLIDFSQRLAGVAPAANISLPTVLAYGAVMDELGQSMESSSTAIGQFIVEMGADIPKFAKIAGMSIKDFSKLLKEDANEAFLRVLDRSKTAGGGLQALAQNMGILEVSGARGIAALGAMADNIDLVRSRLETANVSFDEGTSIINEFDTVNTNLAANLEKIWNNINELWENSTFRDLLTDLTGWLVNVKTATDKASESFAKNKEELNRLEGEIEPLISRYDELSSKGKLNSTEQEELRKIISRLSEEWPIAATEVDNYGNALGINTQILRQNIAEHQNYLRYMNSESIKEAELHKERQERYRDTLLNEIKTKKTKTTTSYGVGEVFERNLSNEELQKKIIELQEVNKTIAAVNTSLKKMGVDNYIPFDTKTMNEHSANVLNNVDAIEKRIKELQTDLGKEGLSPVQFKETESAILSLQKRIEQLKKVSGEVITPDGKSSQKTGSSKKSDADRQKEEQKRKEDQAKKHFEQLLKDEEIFSAQKLIDQKDKNDKEIAQLELDYKRKIDKFKEFLSMEGALDKEKSEASAKIEELENEKKNKVDELKLKQEKELVKRISEIRSELSNKMESEYDREVSMINQKYDEQLKSVGSSENQIALIEEARAAALTDAKIREEERLAKVKEQLENESEAFSRDKWQSKINQVRRKYDEEIALLKEKNSKEIQETEAFKEVIKAYETNKENEILEIKRQKQQEQKDFAIGVAQNISDAVFSIMSNNIQAESDAKISAIEKQREKELSNKNLTEKQKQAIQEKYDKQISAEKLRAWKAQKKADILQATINTALAVTRALPNWILAAAAGVAGAAQIAVMASQKPPQFAKGGFIPQGSSHAQGGINLIDSRTGSLVGNVEGREPILSRSTYANNREIVDALLYSSQRLNGSRIQIRPDLISAEMSMRSSSPNNSQVVNVNAPGTDNSEVVQLLRQLVNKQDNPRPLIFNNRLYQEFRDDVVQLENRVNG